jgi:hypothetical protein
MTHCVASQRVYIAVVNFVTDSFRKLLDTPVSSMTLIIMCYRHFKLREEIAKTRKYLSGGGGEL